jgi:hypothetical protein
MIASLTNAFSFKSALDLVRIGRENDGGYLVSKSDIDNSDVLIGLGIGDDWSFESDFKKMQNVEVFAFDAGVSRKYFLKQFIKSLTRIDNLKISLRLIKTLLSYRHFFLESSNHHIPKFVGLDTDDENHCTLEQILDDMTYQNIFLKIDVEGSEYRFLETLVAHQNRISGLVIEFHDSDVHLKSITSFINKFNLNLVHIHANNCSPIRASDGLPLVLELSFSKHCKTFGETSLPHKFDMPNWKGKEDIHLIINS